jgi:hypothetical protein
MKTLLHPVVAVVVCVAAAVWFAAAGRIHAMTPAEPSSPAGISELSVASAVTAVHMPGSALDFWRP